jgi:hypothetical protein
MDEFEANLRRVRAKANEFEVNLSHIKTQPNFPFPRYKTDAMEYMYAELFWLYLFKAVVGDNQDAAWVAWMPPDTLKEGNPLFSVINYMTRRAFRVVHIFSQMEDEEIAQGVRRPASVYYSEYQEDDWGEDPRPNSGNIFELTICSDLSRENELLARRFIALFCLDNAPMDVIEREIREYEAENFPYAPPPQEE